MVLKFIYKGIYHLIHPILRPLRRLFLFVSRRQSARVLLIYKNEILLIRNIGSNRWSLPGGGLARKEKPEAAALRELQEELGITNVYTEHKLGTYHSHKPGQHGNVHVFVINTESLHHKRQWEIDESRWFELGNLPANLSPATARRIGEYKNGLISISTFW